MFHMKHKRLVGPSGFEPELNRPKRLVLPLHYGPFIMFHMKHLRYSISVKLYIFIKSVSHSKIL